MMRLGLVVLFASFEITLADYKCLCSYTVERDVHTTPSNDSNVIGYMYEFDCKPMVTETGGWFVVEFEHEVGYIEDGERLEVQTCPGKMPDEDKVTSLSTSATTSLQTSFTSSSSNSYSINAIVPSITPSSFPTIETTETIALTTSTFTAPTVPESSSATPSAVSSSPTITTTASPSITSTASSVTTQTSTVTTVHVTQSAMHACKVFTQQSNTAFSNSNYCYELVTQHTTFFVAENDCSKKGGHLAHIKNDQDQQFITSNVNHILSDHYIWIGLLDTAREEHFIWTSGEPLTYTHWYPGRKDFFLHGLEDCVAIKMGNFVHAFDGAWEDLPCSRAHAYICQYDLRSGPHLIG